MRDNKNIDRLFQENLKDFEVFPPNRIWGKIEKNLPSNSRKNRFPRWFKIASVAAMLLLLFGIGTIYLLPKDSLAITFFSKTPEKTPEDILYFINPENLKQNGLQVKNLPALPTTLGKMKPFQWYYYDGSGHEPHHGGRIGREFIVMAIDVK